jgi:hypothetical protein
VAAVPDSTTELGVVGIVVGLPPVGVLLPPLAVVPPVDVDPVVVKESEPPHPARAIHPAPTRARVRRLGVKVNLISGR